MVYCQTCKKDVPVDTDDARGDTVCTLCGDVVDDNAIVSEIGFVDNNAGGRHLRIAGAPRQPREETLENGRRLIKDIGHSLGIRQDAYLDQAQQFYKMAVTKNFVQGRRTEHVVAACLYIVCRLRKTAHMLIDFSDVLQLNMYVIGLVFLKLSKLLSMLKFPVIDPSLYIHRFASKLEFGNKEATVARTALQLVQSMKRDWMQSGRRPTGICGAALFISAKVHNFERTITDIIQVVRVGETTLKKRLTEFELTQASLLTVEEFNKKAEEWDTPAAIVAGVEEDPSDMIKCANCEVIRPKFDKGFCQSCYEEWVRSSGGCIEGSSDPAAYTNNRKKDEMLAIAHTAASQIPLEAIEAAKKQMERLLEDPSFLALEKLPENKTPTRRRKKEVTLPKLLAIESAPGIDNILQTSAPPGFEENRFAKVKAEDMKVVVIGTIIPAEVKEEPLPVNDSVDLDENDDDEEVRNSLLTEEESRAKTKVWMELNKDYLDAKEERDRLIAAGIIKQRPTSRKKKQEAKTAQEAIDGVVKKKKMNHTSGVLSLEAGPGSSKQSTGKKQQSKTSSAEEKRIEEQARKDLEEEEDEEEEDEEEDPDLISAAKRRRLEDEEDED